MVRAKQIHCTRGQGAAEYIIGIILVAIIVLVAVRHFGSSVKCQFDSASQQIDGGAGLGSEDCTSETDLSDSSTDSEPPPAVEPPGPPPPPAPAPPPPAPAPPAPPPPAPSPPAPAAPAPAPAPSSEPPASDPPETTEEEPKCVQWAQQLVPGPGGVIEFIEVCVWWE